MRAHPPIDDSLLASHVSTGALPPAGLVQELVDEAYERYQLVEEGAVASYIPALARVRHDLFGLCVTGVNGAPAAPATPVTSSPFKASPNLLSSHSYARRSGPISSAARSASTAQALGLTP